MKILRRLLLLVCLTIIFNACTKDDVGDALDEGLVLAALQHGKWYFEDIGNTPDSDWNCIHYAWYKFNSDKTLSTGSVKAESSCDDIEVVQNAGTWELVALNKVKITYNNGFIEEFKNLGFPGDGKMSADISTGNNTSTIVFDQVAGPEPN